MFRGTALGVVFTLLGLTGYVAGVFVEYPGRAFSLTALMLGVVLLAIAHRPAGVTER